MCGRGGVKDWEGIDCSWSCGGVGLDCDSDRCLENCEGHSSVSLHHSPTLHLGEQGRNLQLSLQRFTSIITSSRRLEKKSQLITLLQVGHIRALFLF